MSNISCDIIIPIYNALDELKECVQSLVKYTNLRHHRIILINDCSPDENVGKYLNNLNNQNILVLHNDSNIGFVGTVNKGMSYSDRDVILLNSDTIVTENWLDKMVEVAYSNFSIATVTPLTNNGSICSVPNFLEDNTIPEGYTIDSFAAYIEKISLKEYPEIPTAVGFCMFIKRTVINEIGLFDDKTFGKGYAEENDFCCRVIEHGYKNVLDDHTFIYHKGSMSFKGEKLNLLKKNLDILNQRYPYYEQSVHDFIVKNPLKPIHDNIYLRLESSKFAHEVKGNILFVLHNFFDEPYNHPIGGTEYHVKDIVLSLENYNSYVIVTNGNEVVMKQYRDGRFIAKYNFPFSDPLTLKHFHHKEYSEIIQKIIGSFDISLVHIHHLIKHSFDIPYIAKKYNIKVLFTLHDYYLFCPKVNLLDENNNYCIDMRSEEKCSSCLRASYGFHTTFINKWREEVKKMLPLIDKFITPSEFTKQLFQSEYPIISDRIDAIPHGVIGLNNSEKNASFSNKKVWNIGFLGGLSPNKGSDLIYRLITKYSNKNLNWHLIGGLGDQRLNLINKENVIKHGEYKREELSDILEEIDLDLICLLSPWPETFSYTLSEAWLHNIPVLVTPMGALKERVEEVGGGWISDSIDLDDIIIKLNQILDMKEDEVLTVKRKIASYKFVNKHEMVQKYNGLYELFDANVPSINLTSFSSQDIVRAIKYYLPEDSLISENEYHNQVQKLEEELQKMRSTIGWKVLAKLRAKNSLILRLGKRAIYLFLKIRKTSMSRSNS
ncbi:glycosyltransferase [Paenibacillus sp. FSL M8-0334]|uniref:glycosyltransferase n=1 Tax=Paenibacillus sp. FSL M8-0334 TaxID=2921623 RepID=UPI0030F4C311